MPPGAFNARTMNRKWPAQMDSLVAAILLVIPEGKTIVDIGAGVGGVVKRLREAGRTAWGVDGIPDIAKLTDSMVIEADLTKPIQFLPPPEWAITIEVGEHIPPDLEQAFLRNLASAASEGLVVSWAVRAQADEGIGHVNCLDAPEVAERLWRHGWRINRVLTRRACKRVRRPFRKKLQVFTPR